MLHEVEASSEISSHYSSQIKQSSDIIEREVFVYNSFLFPWDGIIIYTLIRIDKSVNGSEWKTHYYISNDKGNAQYFLKKVLQEWTVETMHFYKDCALHEDKCKVNKGAFSLSVLRSIVLNILHLNRVKNIARQITKNKYSLVEALTLFSFIKFEYGFLI
ncbi:MAG TPA: hypothetical protein EYP02_05885 [Sulfurovum sp.]|nr:hypothetical protein [Sulfurovum sp.]